MHSRLELPYESLYKIYKIVQNPTFKKLVSTGNGEKSDKGAYNLAENRSIIIVRHINDRSYVLSDWDAKLNISKIQSKMLV